MSEPSAYRHYRAFLSYRHADNAQEGRRWAEWLHRSLERYTVPPDLVGTPNLRGEPIPDSLYSIFRDEELVRLGTAAQMFSSCCSWLWHT